MINLQQVLDFALSWLIGAVDLAIAIVALLPSNRSRSNWFLAAWLSMFAASDFWQGLVLTDPVVNYNAFLWGIDAFWLALASYILFIGSAIPSPIAAPLRRTQAYVVVGLCAVGLCLLTFVMPQLYLGAATHQEPNGSWKWSSGPILNVPTDAFTVVWAVAIIAALHAIARSHRGSIARKQTTAYAIAFGLLDASFLYGNWSPDLPADLQWLGINTLGGSVLFTIAQYAGLVGILVGMVRYQLFDFDLKVKWTLKRGTLVAVVLIVFFVATAIAEQYLQGYGFVVGGIAIGLLLFAIRPVERAIDRLADRAMPRTTGTPEYVAFRKLEVYKAAVESAHETGGISARERASLDRLRAKLSIAEADAARIEADVTGSISLDGVAAS
jgi:hypothetical protein